MMLRSSCASAPASTLVERVLVVRVPLCSVSTRFIDPSFLIMDNDALLHVMCSNERKQVYQTSGIGSSPLEDQCGMTQGMRYCCAITISPSMDARMRLWTIVLRTINPSFPTRPVVETPVVTFCGDTILLITAPDELVAAIRTGLRLSRRAATTCRLPKSALLEVSLPLRKQAIQPRNTEKKGKIAPTEATARPSV